MDDNSVKKINLDAIKPLTWSTKFRWWLRDLWRLVPYSYRIENFWYSISARLWNDRQKWLRKSIPYVWQDKDILIENILYQMIIHFVEKDGEDCFNVVEFDKQNETKIREIYKWAKTGRAAKQKELENAYPDTNYDKNKSYKEIYADVIRLEKEIEEKDTEYLIWIVSSRSILWT